MVLSSEQVMDLKDQLREQVASLPADKKEQALKQIDSLSSEALEAMIQQQQDKNQGQKDQKGIFRMIIDGDIDAVKVDGNDFASAFLEIAPISEGHTIVIPKSQAKEIKDLPPESFELAKKVVKNIVERLKAKSCEVLPDLKFGEAIINIIPIYDKPLNLASPRSKTDIEQLKIISEKINTEPYKMETIKIETKSSQKDPVLKLSRRIP